MTILQHVTELLDAIREPLGVDRWDIRLKSEPIADARAYCLASPEYRSAEIVIDPDKLQTGDVLQEVAVHETTHLHTWKLLEEVRQAGEEVTTDVGHAYLRLLRRAGVLDSPVNPA
jgi:hypothetical protein